MNTTTEQLREKYSHELQWYIASRVQWPACGDILQQVFLKVHDKLDTLTDENKIKSRMYRITQHAIIDWYRKEQWGKIQNMNDFFRESVEEVPDSEQATLAKNISSCLLPMIDDLNDVEKELMTKYLDGVSQKEIALQTWESVSNIKVLIHRSKKKLQKKYSQCCYQYRDENGVLIDTRCSKNCGCDNSVLPIKN